MPKHVFSAYTASRSAPEKSPCGVITLYIDASMVRTPNVAHYDVVQVHGDTLEDATARRAVILDALNVNARASRAQHVHERPPYIGEVRRIQYGSPV